MEIAGIDTEFIVASLMQIEERPLLVLQARQDAARTAVDAIGIVRSKVDAFRLAAARLADVGSFDRYAATVSDDSILTASVSASASPGSLTFSVDQLARAHGLRSIGTVASSSIPITNDALLAVASGTRPLGVNSVRAGTGLGEGSLSLSVTQASTAASTTGTTTLAASTEIKNNNDEFDLRVNGVDRTITITHGTYDAQGLTQAVQDTLDASGGGVSVALDPGGTLSFTTLAEGSSADLELTGGNQVLTALGHPGDSGPHVGTDALIDVDGTTTTVTFAEAGQAVAVDTGAGTLDVVLSGGLHVGTNDIEVVSTGDRSLEAIAAAINDAGAGVSAAAVRVDDNSWRLQLSAATTGLDGALAIDRSVFDAIGGMIESSTAQDSRIRIGEGVGAYDIVASGNTFTDVLPGVTLTAKAVSVAPVTVDVRRDDAAISSDVSNLVSAANDLLAEIKVQTRYDVDSGSSGALVGNSSIRRLADQVRQALGAQVAGVSGLASTAGIQGTRDGSFTFDSATFISAIGDDPAIVERLFGRGGTATGDAMFAAAGPGTVAGAYDVDVTAATVRAESGLLFDGGAAADARVGVRIGTVTATYDVSAGQSAAQIIDGLNASIAAAGLDLVAEVDGTGLNIRADDWGSGGDFELNTDLLGVGTWDARVGADVQGTIDGVTASGIGRRLSLSPLDDSPAAGLAVDISPGVTGALGAVEYQPGIAARVVELATALTEDENGALTSASDFASRRVEDFNDQIARLEDRLVIRETNLRRQWANLQTLLGGLQNQGDWLSGQLAGLSNNWGPSS